MADTKRISLVLDNSMIRALQAASASQRRTQSAIIRSALARELGVQDGVQVGGHQPDAAAK